MNLCGNTEENDENAQPIQQAFRLLIEPSRFRKTADRIGLIYCKIVHTFQDLELHLKTQHVPRSKHIPSTL